MKDRLFASFGAVTVVAAAMLAAPVFISAQAPAKAAPAKSVAQAAPAQAKTAPAKPAAAKAWTMPKTPDGQPDLQGYWTSLSFTPMERPVKYGTREFMTDEETDAFYKAGVDHSYEFTFANSSETPVYDATVYALDAWQNGVKPNRRTSLIVDPPDGRLPPMTPEAQATRARRGGGAQRAVVDEEGARDIQIYNDFKELGGGVRCLTFGGPPIPAGSNYNNNTFIAQGPGYVLVEYEWGSETRVIPLDGRPHLGANIRPWHGDSRGHWEGNTLVVETTNFRPGATPAGANPKTLKMTERFTRLDADTIEYKFTMDDPSTWTRPWTAIEPLSHVDGPMFEYACHEGNNGLINIMEGSRKREKDAAEAAAKKSSK